MIRDDLYDAGLGLRREMFGSAGAEDQVEHTSELDDKLQEIVTRNCFGDIWQRDGLERRTRSLITVAMLLALGRSHELRIHINGALSNGVSTRELREVMLHSYLYCGIPAAVEGVYTLERIVAERETGQDSGESAS